METLSRKSNRIPFLPNSDIAALEDELDNLRRCAEAVSMARHQSRRFRGTTVFQPDFEMDDLSTSPPALAAACGESFCLLGCVCGSLSRSEMVAVERREEHCHKETCMMLCICKGRRITTRSQRARTLSGDFFASPLRNTRPPVLMRITSPRFRLDRGTDMDGDPLEILPELELCDQLRRNLEDQLDRLVSSPPICPISRMAELSPRSDSTRSQSRDEDLAARFLSEASRSISISDTVHITRVTRSKKNDSQYSDGSRTDVGCLNLKCSIDISVDIFGATARKSVSPELPPTIDNEFNDINLGSDRQSLTTSPPTIFTGNCSPIGGAKSSPMKDESPIPVVQDVTIDVASPKASYDDYESPVFDVQNASCVEMSPKQSSDYGESPVISVQADDNDGASDERVSPVLVIQDVTSNVASPKQCSDIAQSPVTTMQDDSSSEISSDSISGKRPSPVNSVSGAASDEASPDLSSDKNETPVAEIQTPSENQVSDDTSSGIILENHSAISTSATRDLECQSSDITPKKSKVFRCVELRCARPSRSAGRVNYCELDTKFTTKVDSIEQAVGPGTADAQLDSLEESVRRLATQSVSPAKRRGPSRVNTSSNEAASSPELVETKTTKPLVQLSEPQTAKKRRFTPIKAERIESDSSASSPIKQEPFDAFGGSRFLRPVAAPGYATKKFKCTYEGCFFATQKCGNYKAHIACHTGEKPFVCSYCGKGFGRRGNLKTHTRYHTGERPWVCTQCGQGFAESCKLKRHMLYHSGKKEFPCEMCDRRFTTKWDLKAHLHYHTGERAHGCEICGKAFFEGGHLQTHMLSHSQEKPFQCEECGKRFKMQYTMKKHALLHAGVKGKRTLGKLKLCGIKKGYTKTTRNWDA